MDVNIDEKEEERENSVDRFIRNGYSADEMRDHEYLSDSSLRLFLQDLKEKGIPCDANSQPDEEMKSSERVMLDYNLNTDD